MKLTFLVWSIACIILAGVSAHAHTVDQNGIIRGKHGRVLIMSLTDGIDACAKHGMRLPTIRELLKLFQSYGSVVKDAKDLKDAEIDEEYLHEIATVGLDGKSDVFYYGFLKYIKPQGDLGKHRFWSSSVPPLHTEFAFNFVGSNGTVRGSNRNIDYYKGSAVRCVAGE